MANASGGRDHDYVGAELRVRAVGKYANTAAHVWIFDLA